MKIVWKTYYSDGSSKLIEQTGGAEIDINRVVSEAQKLAPAGARVTGCVNWDESWARNGDPDRSIKTLNRPAPRITGHDNAKHPCNRD